VYSFQRLQHQTNAKYGYFLDQELSLFDNEFFRISGIEAESMDPQQRLLLEVVYEALENGKPPQAIVRYNKPG
jgi:acyl transferase domain-containing protein